MGSGEKPVSWSTATSQQGALSLGSFHSNLLGEKLRLRAEEDAPYSDNPPLDFTYVWPEASWENLSLLFHWDYTETAQKYFVSYDSLKEQDEK